MIPIWQLEFSGFSRFVFSKGARRLFAPGAAPSQTARPCRCRGTSWVVSSWRESTPSAQPISFTTSTWPARSARTATQSTSGFWWPDFSCALIRLEFPYSDHTESATNPKSAQSQLPQTSVVSKPATPAPRVSSLGAAGGGRLQCSFLKNEYCELYAKGLFNGHLLGLAWALLKARRS